MNSDILAFKYKKESPLFKKYIEGNEYYFDLLLHEFEKIDYGFRGDGQHIMQREAAEFHFPAWLGFLHLIAFIHYAHQGYTLKRNGWHLRGLYRFSREDGMKAMLAGEAPF